MSGEDLQKKLAQFEGKMGILVDQMDVARVRLCDLTIEGNLVRVGFVALETPGLNRAGPPEPIVYSTDARVLENADYWTAPYAGWRIYFDLKVIERVLAIVASMPAGTTYRDDYTSRPAATGSRFATVRSPGPFATALYGFLRRWDSRPPGASVDEL
jgi:hypothetical protein